ncbi:hypothetical protein JCM6882_007179 [Rhodosporidiobolus microsporus]
MSDDSEYNSDTTAVNSPRHSRSPSTDARNQQQRESPTARFAKKALRLALHPAYAVLLWAGHYLLQVYQLGVRLVFAGHYHPLPPGEKKAGRIAVIGAGLTGVASAAHAVDHGFDVVIFEAASDVGGIWAKENSTSQLQLSSFLYRFHPSISWSKAFPQRDEIVEQIRGVWERYELEEKTRFETRVTQVIRDPDSSTDPREGGHGRWIINDGKEGIFDAIIVAIGTCGEPKRIEFEGQDSFRGQVLHSSELDQASLSGKKVVIIGSGASGVEAAELAVNKGAKDTVVLARSDKWIIPRNTLFDILLSLQPFGREMPLSFIPEWIIRKFHYGSLEDLSPTSKGLFEGTPVVNDEFLEHIRAGKITYKRGDTKAIVPRGVKFVERARGTKSGDDGDEGIERADVIIIATGYERPSVDFLPQDLFPTEKDRDYHRPSLYLQNFSVEDWSILMTNASYQDGLGTVGNWHIGILARVLMVFLLDETTRPKPVAMKTWVDAINWVKKQAWQEESSGLTFFTYAEMCIWIVLFHLFNPRRLPWLPFVLFGFGVRPGRGRYTADAIKKAEQAIERGAAQLKRASQHPQL